MCDLGMTNDRTVPSEAGKPGEPRSRVSQRMARPSAGQPGSSCIFGRGFVPPRSESIGWTQGWVWIWPALLSRISLGTPDSQGWIAVSAAGLQGKGSPK